MLNDTGIAFFEACPDNTCDTWKNHNDPGIPGIESVIVTTVAEHAVVCYRRPYLIGSDLQSTCSLSGLNIFAHRISAGIHAKIDQLYRLHMEEVGDVGLGRGIISLSCHRRIVAMLKVRAQMKDF